MRKEYLITFFVMIGIVCIVLLFLYHSFSIHLDDQPGEADLHGEEVVLSFWRNYGNDLENLAFQELVADFEQLYPEIKVQLHSIPYGDYEMRVRTEFATGQRPDILMIDSPNLALYADNGILRPLNDYIEIGSLDDFPPATLQGLYYEENLYLLPIVESSIALFYNIPLFEEAGLSLPSKKTDEPLTWEEVREYAIQITSLSKDYYGIDPAQGFAAGESAAYFKLPILWQFGADVLSMDGETAEGYLNSPEALNALAFYQDLYQVTEVASADMTSDPFENGVLGMTVLGSWAISELEGKHQLVLDEDFGVAPLPKEKYQIAPSGGWSLAITADSKHPEEAWKFIEFVTGKAGMQKYVQITGDIPARYSVAEAIPELNEYPLNIFMEQAHYYSKNRPVTVVYPAISEAVKRLFEEVGMENKDVREAADQAVSSIQSALEENR